MTKHQPCCIPLEVVLRSARKPDLWHAAKIPGWLEITGQREWRVTVKRGRGRPSLIDSKTLLMYRNVGLKLALGLSEIRQKTQSCRTNANDGLENAYYL